MDIVCRCRSGRRGGEAKAKNAFLAPGMGEYQGTYLRLILIKIWICFRDLLRADWISWVVLVWFACFGFAATRSRILTSQSAAAPRNRRRSAQNRKVPEAAGRKRASDSIASFFQQGIDLPAAAAGRLILFGSMIAFFTTLISFQPVWLPGVDLDLRYFVPALPFLLLMKALFAEWAWQKSRLAGIAVASLIIFTSVGAAPFNMRMVFTNKKITGDALAGIRKGNPQPLPRSLPGNRRIPARERESGRFGFHNGQIGRHAALCRRKSNFLRKTK